MTPKADTFPRILLNPSKNLKAMIKDLRACLKAIKHHFSINSNGINFTVELMTVFGNFFTTALFSLRLNP